MPGDSCISGLMVATLAFWCFALLHSTLVSLRFQSWVEGRVGKVLMLAFYRLAFTIINGIALAALGLVILNTPDRNLYSASGALYWALRSIQVLGLVLLLLSARRMDLLEFVGLRQAYHLLAGREVSEDAYPFRRGPFETSGVYRLVRHPQYLAILLIMWPTPIMSLTHFILALNVTLYFWVGSYLEERRLVAQFGQEYTHYRRGVPRLLPWRWLWALVPRAFPTR